MRAFVVRSALPGSWVAFASLLVGPALSWAQASVPDTLLAVDQNRAAVVERIVAQWGPTLATAKDHVSIDALRERLLGLRADALLAASVAGSEEGLRRAATLYGATEKAPLTHAKALGDTAADVVYTPVTPCRLVETRGSFPAVYQGAGPLHTPAPFAPDEVRTYTLEGTNGVCLAQLPATLTPSAVQLQVFGMPTSSKSGDVEILPQGSAFGNTATMVYVSTIAFNTVSTAAKVNVANKQISVQVRGGGAHLAIDVVGYFSAPTGNGGQYLRQGGNAFGMPAILGTNDNQGLAIIVNNQAAVRYLPNNAQSPNIIGGYGHNTVGLAPGQVIAGGGREGDCFPTLGTRPCRNQSDNSFTFIGGGLGNLASAASSVIGGGQINTASAVFTTVGGGADNVASSGFATVGGGSGNIASGGASTVPGGASNVASGGFSFAAGNRAKANGNGTFVWGDSQPFDLVVPFANNFVARATGGFMLISKIDGSGNAAEFCTLSPGVPGWSCTSDRAAKENFIAADGVDILQRLSAMPLYSWNFKGAADVRSLGPTAQDFHAAFGLGNDDKTVATANVAGVAIAAIQGLHRVVQEKDARIDSLERDLAQLRREFEVISATIAGRTARERE